MRRKLIVIVGILVAVLIGWVAHAQTQTVKGQIIDAQAAYPLLGATVGLVGSNPYMGTIADVNGYFRLEQVPLGRHTLVIQYLGYKSQTIPNVLVTAGKEAVLLIKLEESVEKMEEIVITADANKDLPINELAKVSARTFSLEEVTRFSGGRNDVARMAASFAGVSAPDDSRNDIVVRGNSPSGLLWRIEGLPVATVNHYNTLGSTGGPVSALNTNLLRTSDFITGAFPAEYGNANAAVFDVNFRNGNTDTYEFTGQVAAFSGMEFMAEGPIDREKRSSFIASYRYGIARFAAPGTSAIPIYHDLSFKANFGESKMGKFELFGLGGASSIDFLGDEIDETDLFANPNKDSYVDGTLGVVGLSHLIRIGKKTYIKSIFGVSGTTSKYQQDHLTKDSNDHTISTYRETNMKNSEIRYNFSSTLHKKFNARWSLRTGVVSELYDVDFFLEDRDNHEGIPDNNQDGIPDYFRLIRNFDGQYHVSQAFAQASYRITDDLSLTGGLHSQYHSYSTSLSFEPRAAISWQYTPTQRMSLAYGLHSQSVPSPILFYEEETSPEVYEKTNKHLGFTKSHHVVLGYDVNLGPNWRLKAEAYYQYLFDVPVERVSSSYSILNEGADFVFQEKGSLAPVGTGRNYGIEATVEKFFSRGYYLLMTTSLFQSNYIGSDGIERSTAFDNRLVYNVLFGKEWKFGKNQKNAWTFDTKLTTSGGKPYTPIDLESSRNNAGEEVRFEERAYSQRYGNYFRWDVKFGVRINSSKKNISHQFFVDLQNVTHRKNEFVKRYNEVTDQINVVEQIGFFPDVLYRIQF